MLRKRSLLICLVAVTFCFVAIESAEACYDSYWLVDCYEDYYGNFWVCWWDCYNCCFEWICLEDPLLALFLDSHVGFEKVPYCGINDDNIYTFWDGGDVRRGALPFMGSKPQNRTDNLLVHDDPSGGGGGAAPPPKGRACFVAETPALVDGKLVEIQMVTGTTLEEHEGTFVCRDIILETSNTISVVDSHCFLTDAGQ